MLGLRKSTKHISKLTCEWIPLIPLDREWTDEELYKYFNLNENEIELIENYVKTNKMTINKTMKKKREEKKSLVILDEIKVIINGKDENKNSDDMNKYTVEKLKKICDDNKISRIGCKVKQNYIDLIMSSTEKVIINV